MKNSIYTLAFLLGFGIVSLTAQDISLTNTKLDAPSAGQEYGQACFTIISEDGIDLTGLPLAVEISLSQVDFQENGVFGFNSDHFDFEVDPFTSSVIRGTLTSSIPDVDNGGGGAQICIPVSASDYTNARNGFVVNIVPGGVDQNGATSNDYIERFGFAQSNQYKSSDNTNMKFEQNITTRQLEGYDMEVYPNPTSDYIKISSIGEVGIGSISVFNNTGVLIYTNASDQKSIEIDVQEWRNGMYLVEVRNNENKIMKTEKVVVLK